MVTAGSSLGQMPAQRVLSYDKYGAHIRGAEADHQTVRSRGSRIPSERLPPPAGRRRPLGSPPSTPGVGIRLRRRTEFPTGELDAQTPASTMRTGVCRSACTIGPGPSGRNSAQLRQALMPFNSGGKDFRCLPLWGPHRVSYSHDDVSGPGRAPNYCLVICGWSRDES